MQLPDIDYKKEFPNIRKTIAAMSQTNKRKILYFDELFRGRRFGFEDTTDEDPSKRNKDKELIDKLEKKRLKQRNKKQNEQNKQTFHTIQNKSASPSRKEKTVKTQRYLLRKQSPLKTSNPSNLQTITSSNTDNKKQTTYLPPINTGSTFIHTQIPITRKPKRHTQRNADSTESMILRKQTVVNDTNSQLKTLNTNCQTIENEITDIKKPTDDPAKILVLENVDDVIDEEIKGFVRAEPNMNEVQMTIKKMVDTSVYASKMNEKFAYDAENVINEIFNREYIMAKKKKDDLKLARNTMKKTRLTLRTKLDDLLKNYTSTIMRCYDTLNSAELY